MIDKDDSVGGMQISNQMHALKSESGGQSLAHRQDAACGLIIVMGCYNKHRKEMNE